MREAAAEVEEGLILVAQAGEEGRVVGGEVDGEVEEKELADAGVGEDVPGFFTLWEDLLADASLVVRKGVLGILLGSRISRRVGLQKLTIAITCCSS